ncbi:hypothetical protein HY218_02560 [Candidatus Saccharibacteria bacterium]|nr:hypothetical protein [Candidatus Saccharibacteria bacterium]
MQGAQLVIDATGRSADIVKRLQVRYSNTVPYLYAVESDIGVCKKLKTQPGSTTYDSINIATTADRDVCDPTKP